MDKALLYRQLHFTAPLPPPGFVHWRITEGTGRQRGDPSLSNGNGEEAEAYRRGVYASGGGWGRAFRRIGGNGDERRDAEGVVPRSGMTEIV